jgi:hypothetical protein
MERGRRDQQYRRGAGGEQREEVVVALERCQLGKSRREWRSEQEGEQHLHARLHHPDLLHQLGVSTLTAARCRQSFAYQRSRIATAMCSRQSPAV